MPTAICARAFGLVVAIAGFAAPALSQDAPGNAPRVALVMGNSSYQSIPALPNPANDARIIAEKLWESGFEVIESIDADRETMLADLATFRSRLHEGSEAVFFFAGHGVQINGRNYLIPVTAAPASVEELVAQSVNAQLVVDVMSDSGARLNLVFLDACRNNPFAEITEAGTSLIETRAMTIGASQEQVSSGLEDLANASRGGLAEMTSGKTETLISFATAPGAVAYDGLGQHSPYTQAIADNIDQPGLEISELFRRVRGDVREATGGEQITWTTSTLESRFYFKPIDENLRQTTTGMGIGSDTLGDLPPQRIVDRTFWRAIEQDPELDALLAYVQTLPEGAFVQQAKQKIRDLGGDVEALTQIDPALAEPTATTQQATRALLPAAAPAELSRGNVAVAIGTVEARLPDNPSGAGWLYVEQAPRLGAVNIDGGDVLTARGVQWVPDEANLSFKPSVGSNGGLEEFVAFELRDNGETSETRVAIETYVDACDVLAGNPYDNQRVTAGTRQFIIQRNFEAAIAVCEIAVENNPDVVRFWAQLARAYRSAGRYEDALFHQQRAVDANYASAMVYLGQMYLDAQAVPRDYARAKELFEQAAERGESAAFTALAWIHRAGVGVPQDYEKALEYYREGAALGNDWAMTNIAEFYQEGFGVEKDINEAVRWYVSAAKSGELTAQTRLARMYQTGDEVETDFEQARFWFEAAAGRGVPNALTRLGLMYERGQGIDKDLEAASRLYTRAARDGDAEAYFRLGRLYASQQPLFDDPARAALLLERAVEDGVYGADRELARLFFTGRGVGKDIARARELFVAAAEGNPWAARDAGRAFASSDGVEPNYEEAARLFRQAAEGGVPRAALDLGRLTAAGRGVEQDRIEALIWFATALGLSSSGNLDDAVTKATQGYEQTDFNTAAQLMLLRIGADIGTADGQIGPRTRQALEAAFVSRGQSLPSDAINLEVLAALSALD